MNKEENPNTFTKYHTSVLALAQIRRTELLPTEPSWAMQRDTLTFISLSGDAAQDTRSTNTLVRAHVMRRYKRQQKAHSSTHADSTDTGKDEPTRAGRSSGRFESSAKAPSTHSDSTSATGPSPPSHLDEDLTPSEARNCQLSPPAWTSRPPPHGIETWLDGKLDPFLSLPIPINQRSLILLQQNASLPLRTSVHSDPSSQYRNVCSKDAAWLFMHLYYAACRFPQVPGGSEATHYLLQSVSAVNSSIVKSPNLIEDSTIATVACLANIENLNGEASSAHIHMHGLLRMVGLKGGLSNLGMRGILRRMVLWSDLLTSLNSQTVPQFPFIVIEKPCPLWHFTPVFLQDNYRLDSNQKLATITTRKHNMILTHLLLSLHELSIFLNSVEDGLLPWDACYPDRVYEVEYRIMLCLFDDSVIAECDDKIAIGQILLQAALLFIYSNLRQTPVGGTVRKTLLSRLRAALDLVDLVRLSRRFTAEVLWILAIGSSTATGMTQTKFIDETRGICAENHVYTWAEVTELLRGVPALLDAHMAACMGSWISNEIVEA